MRRPFLVEAEQRCGSCCRADHASDTRRVEAARVGLGGAEQHADLARDVVADDRRVHHLVSRRTALVSDREQRREYDDARVQRRLLVGVVQLEAVAGDAVGECGILDARP